MKTTRRVPVTLTDDNGKILTVMGEIPHFDFKHPLSEEEANLALGWNLGENEEDNLVVIRTMIKEYISMVEK